MNIQRSAIEGYVEPLSELEGESGRILAELLAEAAATGPAPDPNGPRRPFRRVPEKDVVVVGRKGGSGRGETAEGQDAAGPDAPTRIRSKIRTTLLLLLAAYYLGWGLYEGFRPESPRAIQVNPTLTGGTVIT